MREQKVLFIGHNASRSGAPLVLFELIRWLSANSSIKSEVLLERGGPLLAEYGSTVPTHCIQDCDRTWLLRKLGRFYRKSLRTKLGSIYLRLRYPIEKYPVIYANTIATLDLAMRMAGPNRYVIQHIHEMAYVTECFGATGSLRNSAAVTDIYVAVSEAVKKFLMDNIFVPEEKIRVIGGFPVARSCEEGSGVNPSIRRDLEIPEDAFVIGMCGTPEWRKGIDLFVHLMVEIKKTHEGGACHFIWLGGEERAFDAVRFDIARLGLQECCHLIPAVANPQAYYEAFDLFALTSREDPFPLVMLEAAACGLPIVCFAESGGAPELVGEDAGVVVPYLDVAAMAQACIGLYRDNLLRQRLGSDARAKVKTEYLLAVQGPKINTLIKFAFESLAIHASKFGNIS